MKLNAFFALVIIFTAGLMSCSEDDIIISVDPVKQREIDLAIINEYIADQGYDFNPGDTTRSGVRYLIHEEGTGAPIEYGDIVDLYYVGRFTDREIFDTNIESVDFDNGTYDPLKTYNVQRISHTETGWAIRGTFLTGYVDGVTAVLERMNIGGKAEIIIPSNLAYGSTVPLTSALRDAVLVFEVFPVYKR